MIRDDSGTPVAGVIQASVVSRPQHWELALADVERNFLQITRFERAGKSYFRTEDGKHEVEYVFVGTPQKVLLFRNSRQATYVAKAELTGPFITFVNMDVYGRIFYEAIARRVDSMTPLGGTVGLKEGLPLGPQTFRKLIAEAGDKRLTACETIKQIPSDIQQTSVRNAPGPELHDSGLVFSKEFACPNDAEVQQTKILGAKQESASLPMGEYQPVRDTLMKAQNEQVGALDWDIVEPQQLAEVELNSIPTEPSAAHDNAKRYVTLERKESPDGEITFIAVSKRRGKSEIEFKELDVEPLSVIPETAASSRPQTQNNAENLSSAMPTAQPPVEKQPPMDLGEPAAAALKPENLELTQKSGHPVENMTPSKAIDRDACQGQPVDTPSAHEVLSAIASSKKGPRRTYDKKDIQGIMRYKKSSIHDFLNPQSPRYIPSMPKPFKLKDGRNARTNKWDADIFDAWWALQSESLG